MLCNCSAADPFCTVNATSDVNWTPRPDGRYVFSEYDHFDIGCSVAYAGFWPPTIQCSPLAANHSLTATSSSVSFAQRIQALYNMTGTGFHCAVTFLERDTGDARPKCKQSVEAVNTPSYNHTVASFVISVIRKYASDCACLLLLLLLSTAHWGQFLSVMYVVRIIQVNVHVGLVDELRLNCIRQLLDVTTVHDRCVSALA